MLASTWGISAIDTACEGQPTQFPCNDRLLHYFSFQWSREEVLLENIPEAPTSCQRGWSWWRARTSWRDFVTPQQPTTNNAKLQLFGDAKEGLDMLHSTRDALELKAICDKYQTSIWLQANKEHIYVPTRVATTAWKNDAKSLTAVSTRLPSIPDACVELVTSSCNSKCKTARCFCFKKNWQWHPPTSCLSSYEWWIPYGCLLITNGAVTIVLDALAFCLIVIMSTAR